MVQPSLNRDPFPTLNESPVIIDPGTPGRLGALRATGPRQTPAFPSASSPTRVVILA